MCATSVSELEARYGHILSEPPLSEATSAYVLHRALVRLDIVVSHFTVELWLVKYKQRGDSKAIKRGAQCLSDGMDPRPSAKVCRSFPPEFFHYELYNTVCSECRSVLSHLPLECNVCGARDLCITCYPDSDGPCVECMLAIEMDAHYAGLERLGPFPPPGSPPEAYRGHRPPGFDGADNPTCVATSAWYRKLSTVA